MLKSAAKCSTGLQLFAGYTYNTTKYLDDPDNEGKVFSYVDA